MGNEDRSRVGHKCGPRQRDDLRLSLQNPHPESTGLAEQGLQDWASGLPEEDGESLVVNTVGRPVRWAPGKGWLEDHG